MAEATFRPVRCLDGKTAHGVELVMDCAGDIVHAAPRLTDVLYMMQDHLRSRDMEADFHPAVDAAVVCLRDGRRNRLRSAVQLRLRGPEDASADELRHILDDLACIVAPYLAQCGASCDTPASAADGVLCAFPDGQRPCAVHALLRPHQTASFMNGSRLLWYQELASGQESAFAQAVEIVRGCPGSGFVLHLHGAQPLAQHQLPENLMDPQCRQRLETLAEPGVLAMQCILWETAAAQHPFQPPETPALTAFLQRMPQQWTALPLRHEGLALQLAHDPEAVRARIALEAGGRTTAVCDLCTLQEIGRFLGC